MSSLPDQYITSLTMSPHNNAQDGFGVQWVKEQRALKVTLTFETGPFLQSLADKGYIQIKKMPEGADRYQTMTLAYEIPNEQALRPLANSVATTINSISMCIASDLAKANSVK